MTVDERFIAQRIAQLRILKNISARDMSLSLGQSESYINKIENGKALPSMSGLLNICDYFSISPAEFFSEDIENPLLLREFNKEIKRLSPKQMNSVIELIRSFR